MYADDVKRFGNYPGVKVFNLPAMAADEIRALLNGTGTTIGGFCNSGACLKMLR